MASNNTIAILTPLNQQTLQVVEYNQHGLLVFPAHNTTSCLFTYVLDRAYSAGGLQANIVWTSASATTGNVLWGVSFERHQSGVTNISINDFANPVTGANASPTTPGIIKTSSINITNGAAMDNIAVGESLRLALTRIGTNASDTMLGNAEVISIELKEI